MRILRLVRLFQFIKVIINVLANTMQDFIFLALLLILFIIIYSLLGIQLFGGALVNNTGVRQHFDHISNAFISVFQVFIIYNGNKR